jgi:hypothetical protein
VQIIIPSLTLGCALLPPFRAVALWVSSCFPLTLSYALSLFISFVISLPAGPHPPNVCNPLWREGGYFLLSIVFYVSLFSLFIQVYCPYATLGYEGPTPPSLTDINIHSDTQAEPRKLSSVTLYIDLWQEGKPTPGETPPLID